jgi:hypothetical protein
MSELVDFSLLITDDAVPAAADTAQSLRLQLKVHPVPHYDPRTRGLLLEVDGAPTAQQQFQVDHPVLASLVNRFLQATDAVYIVAVNETPPSGPDLFQMRPHIDRRWLGSGFSPDAPRFTTIVFLDFPRSGRGGELVLFPSATYTDLAAVPREGARATVAQHHGLQVPPQPGRTCRFAGALPHAVLGYSADPEDVWRLVVVVAEFAH